MSPALRAQGNERYTEAGYRAYLDALIARVGCLIEFRIYETPCCFLKR